MKIIDHKSSCAWMLCQRAALIGAVFSSPAHAQPQDIEHMKHGGSIYSRVLLDQLEYLAGDADAWQWDAQAWIGGDYHRAWFKAEGEHSAGGESEGEAEVQALYSRLVAPFWEFQTGIRYDRIYGHDDESRAHAVIGLQGLAPYWFEMTPALFVSQKGAVSARLSAEYDLLLTQRLVLQPSAEADWAARADRALEVGEGLNELNLGLRLRYEIRREFAPYVGIEWSRAYGETADLARGAGEDVADTAVVAGIRAWF